MPDGYEDPRCSAFEVRERGERARDRAFDVAQQGVGERLPPARPRGRAALAFARRSQGAAFQIAELVEHEQRMIAGAFVMAFPDAHLLLAMGRTDAGIHVEHDALRRTANMYAVDPLAG